MHLGRFTALAFFLLVMFGVVGVALRYHARHGDRVGVGDTAWRLTYTIECDALQAAVQIRTASPADTPQCRVFRQDFVQQNLRLDPRGRSSVQAREIVALAEDPGVCQSTLRFDLRLNPRANWTISVPSATLNANQRADYLRATESVQVRSQPVMDTLARLRETGVDQATLVDRVFQHCRQTVLISDEEAADDAATVLEESRGTARGCVHAMIALCRAATIPARPVVGFVIEAGDPLFPTIWLELLLGDRWVPFDPVNGYERELPFNYVPARRGDERVVMAEAAENLEVEYAVAQLPRASLESSAVGQDPRDILDLTRLSLDMQRVLSLILLMPLGALVTCFFRNLIGLKTSGTFTPTLLALSLVFADWKTGLVILMAALVLGVATRYLIDTMQLLILPRLSVMLTLVVLCIVYGISTMDYLRIAPGTQAVLLPMVILTMLVERLYLTTQEDGPAVALQQLAATVIVGLCCYLVMCWDSVKQLIIAYPELHFFTLALLILIGRYTGYQLLEPWRFRDFAESGQT